MKHDKYSKQITNKIKQLFFTPSWINYKGKENAISSYFIVNYVQTELGIKPKDEIHALYWRERIMQNLWNIINPKNKGAIHGIAHVLGICDGKEIAYFFFTTNEKEVIESKNTMAMKALQYEKSGEIKAISNIKFINSLGYDDKNKVE